MIYPNNQKEHEVQMTTLNTPTPSFGGHTFPDFMGPVYFNGEGDSGAAAPAPAPAPSPEPAALAPAPAPAPTGDVDPFEDTSVDKFDRAYVEKLRKEAAEHRTQAKPFVDAFSKYPEEARQAMLEIVSGLVSEDQDQLLGSAQQLRELAAQLLGEDLHPDDPNRPLTKAEFDRLATEQKQREQEEVAVKEVISEAKSLGYEPDTAAAADLLWRAVNSTNGDLKAAHEQIQAERQAIIDQYVKSVQEGSVKFPPVTGNVGDGAPLQHGEQPKTFAEAKARAMARARARAGE